MLTIRALFDRPKAYPKSLYILLLGALAFALEYVFFPKYHLNTWQLIIAISTLAVLLVSPVLVLYSSFKIFLNSRQRQEAQARLRLRLAENKLAAVLSGTDSRVDEFTAREITEFIRKYNNGRSRNAQHVDSGSATINVPAPPGPSSGTDERLALSALWEVTHSRLDLYHQIATGQARRSFVTAQGAITVGFVLLVGFAILSFWARSTAASVTIGVLGAVSAALAGYIGRTFVRSQESAATHLRAYFDQPLEFSRFLAAERLLSTQENLTEDQRTAILMAIVDSIVQQETSPRTKRKGKD